MENQEIKNQFKKTLILVRDVYTFYKNQEKECKPHIDRLVNLLEQYQSCFAMNTTFLPKDIDYVTVKKKLLCKLTTEINIIVQTLQTNM